MKKDIGKRILSLLICLTLVVSYLPMSMWTIGAGRAQAASVMLETQRQRDNSTLHQWKKYFGIQTNHPNNVILSTEFAGGVWTDKSVFTPDDISGEDELKKVEFEDKGDNFLVSLSAIASNKQIKGYSTIPTDTVLILDLSSSMRYTGENRSSAVDELVNATNRAIAKLQQLNVNNRVAVVAYAGTDNASWSARKGKTTVILPLDSYTPATAGKFLESTRNSEGIQDYALQVCVGVKNSAGNAVHANTRFEVSTGTFMQDGLYEAMRVLLAADPVVKAGFQAGTNRMPIMVLMSDGEPTLANENYYGNYTTANGSKTFTGLGNSNLYDYNGNTGGANSLRHRDTIAFLSSLTAAFAKKQVSAHYDEQALMYTLSYGSTVTTLTEAMSVLNPKNASSVQNDLWNSFLDGDDVTVYSWTTGSGWQQQTRHLTTKNATDADLRLDNTDRYYVDGYYAANNDQAMSSAFDAIVDEIELQSRYYPTYVENDHNHDGYLTFVDKIGKHMDVTDVKGIIIGNRLFSGEAFASNLTTDKNNNVVLADDPNNRFIESVRERLSISNMTVAQTLMNNAYQHGQMSYDAQTGSFSHYIGWFSDGTGKFVDFWHEGLTKEQYPAGATHIIRSFGFLGDTAVIPGVPTTDMMFMTVRVATEIATGNDIITWKIPASLVPTVTYEVEVLLDSNGNIQQLQTLELADNAATDPIRLVYEVELEKDITEWNVLEKTGGTTTFYTNKFDAANPSSTTLNTYSHFEPSKDNERYYYTADSLVYTDQNGTVYTGTTKPSGGTYYHRYPVYEQTTGGLRIHYHFEPITVASLSLAEPADGNQWRIPKGTVMRYQDDVTSRKDPNITGTMEFSDHPEIVAEGGHYYTYSTQGNNGKLTVTPATGIKLTKVLTETVSGASDKFYFAITGNTANAKLIRLNAEGEESSREDVTNGRVELTAGETVYIIGLTAGNYTITEEDHADYGVASVKVDSVLQSGTVANVTVVAQSVNAVEFTNMPKGYGSLIISKDVVYPAGFNPADAHNGKQFAIAVTFTGDTTGMVAPAGAVQAGNTYTVQLADGQTCTFRNIPDGVTYTVAENSLPKGYTLAETRYSDSGKTISNDDADQVHVINAYAPESVSVKLKVQGTKTVTGGWPTDATFTIRLWQTDDLAGSEVIKTNRTATVTASNATYTIDISDVAFNKVGTFYISIAEDIPADTDRIADMAYDRTLGLFSVTVTDEDADGTLEIKDTAVVGYQGTPVTGNATDGWIITKDFNNVVTKDLVYLDVEKTLTGYVGNNPPIANITFGLFESMTADVPGFNALTDDQGKATLMIPVTADSLGTGKVYYLREIAPATPNRVVGMHYDESWLYAIRITWDAVNNKAYVEYAPIENGVVGTYVPYVREDVTFTHTNVFTPGVESTPAIELSGTKTMTGDTTELGNRKFSFSLYQADATFKIQGTALQTVENTGSTVAFKPLTFDTPGMKYIVVKENAIGLDYILGDNAEYHVTVLVEKYDDNGTTKLRVANGYPVVVKYGNGNVTTDALDFVNTYKITDNAEITISGTKVMSGRPLLLGGFRFRLTEVADKNGTALAGGLVLEAENGHANNKNEATFTFPAIRYSQEGTHYYLIEELDTGAAGVTYAKNAYVIQVDVTDNQKGQLEAKQTVVSGGSKLVFTNSYKPMPISTSLRSIKELSGMMLSDGQFQFTITQTGSDFATAVPGGLHATVSNDEHGLIQFPDITFAGQDTRYYVIKEVNGGQVIDGITYDDAQYLVTITATDNLLGSLVLVTDIKVKNTVEIDGLLQEVISAASSIVFNNEYTTKGETSLEIRGNKTLGGKALEEGMFTFYLYKTDNTFNTEGRNPIRTTNSADGTFVFDTLVFDEIGEYYFVVKEENGGEIIDGILYDASEYRVTVTVIDDQKGGLWKHYTIRKKNIESVEGQLQEVIVPAYEFTFHNVYAVRETEKLVLRGEKELSGKALADKMFTFSLYETGSDFATDGVTPVTTQNNNDGSFAFGELEFSAAGTWYYVVTEENGGQIVDGTDHDNARYLVTVTTTDNGKGGLNLTTDIQVERDSKTTSAEKIVFSNEYAIRETEKLVLRGEKELTGKDLGDKMFTFSLYETGSNFATEGVTPITTQNSGKSFAFGELEFSAVGTWYYVVTEENGGQIIDGIDYDNARYLITVTTTDNGKGGLDLTTDIQVERDGKATSAEKIVFTNEYALREPATFTPEAVKRYERPEDEQLRAFTFTLTGEGENQTKKNSTVDGKVVFGTLTFREAKTYTYTITEVPDTDLDFIKWDTNVYTLTVVTVDNGRGQVAIESVTATSVKGTNDLLFLNAHEDLILKKDVYLESQPQLSIDGKTVEVGDVLTYEITYTNFNNQTADVVITDKIPQYTTFLSANNGGSFADGTITWDLKNIPADASVTVSFQVKVVGGADEKISNRATVLDGENTYASNEVVNSVKEDTVSKDVFLSGDTTVSIDGKVVNPGQILQYQITYVNSDDFPAEVTITDTIPAHTSYVDGSADMNGVFADGKLTWKLQLNAGEEKTVTFQVKVEESGATVVNQASAQEGENTVETNKVENPVADDVLTKDVSIAAEPTVSIDGKQVAKGTVLLYTITYTNTDSQKAVATIVDTIPAHTTYVKDSADHNGIFENGAITWVLELAAGESKTVSFCVKVNDYGATVTNQAVSYDGTNKLESNQVTTESEPKPEPETPETGDGMQLILWISLLVSSAAALAVGVINRKKVVR